MPKPPARPSMLQPGSAEETLPDDIPALEALLAALDEEEKLWNVYVRELSGLEDPARGVFFAAALHEARQYRMVIKYRKDFCRARLRRLNSPAA